MQAANFIFCGTHDAWAGFNNSEAEQRRKAVLEWIDPGSTPMCSLSPLPDWQDLALG
jgi:hypothetical protein